ncbi:MAG: methionyl-tRNA formyltransferase [Ignavibacteria bacterium]|nr:methionyl-tRNA formyltransferase [Ignavibacteria bacterium]
MFNDQLKIILMGSPDFGVPAFNAIIEKGFNVPYVVTVPDKQKGRGLKLHQSEVKNFALEKNIPVLQPESLKDEDFISKLKEIQPDLFIIIAFRILPAEVFKIPKFGSINLHASLLPKYRGAAPINWAIINGETESGITTFFLNEKVDTGNIILQKKVQIGIDETFGEVYSKMSAEGPGLVLKTIDLIISESYNLIPQDNLEWTKAPKLFRDKCVIDWRKQSFEIHNFVRGLSPVPCAFTKLNGKVIKILRTKLTDTKSNGLPGVLNITGKSLFINTADNLIEILELQPEGKKPMQASAFINGLNKESVLAFD